MKKVIWGTGICMLLVLVVFVGYSFMENHFQEPSVDNDRMTYFYRHPKADQLVPILESELKRRDLVKDGIQVPPFVHFFATAFHQNPDQLPELKIFETVYSGNGKEVIKKIITQAENYQPAEFKSPKDLELLWAEFQATGNQAIIDQIIKQIESRERPSRNHFLEKIRSVVIQNISFAALFLDIFLGESQDEVEVFLINKIRHHGEVYQYLRKESEDENGTRKKETVNRLLNWATVSIMNPVEKHIGKGKNLINLQKYEDGIKEYKKGLSYFPDNSWVYMNIGIAYEYLGKMDQSISFSKKAIEIDPENATAAYNLGRNYFRIKQYDDAIQAYLKAMEYHPDHPSVNHALARAYQVKGEKENAVVYFKKYLELAPDGEHVQLVKGYLASVGQPVTENPNDILVLLKKKRYDALEGILTSILKKREKNDEAGHTWTESAYHLVVAIVLSGGWNDCR